jgi:type IV fimbrial biogenesis protein FimT
MFKVSKRIAGFTLVEMIVTVTIAGILAAIAIPSFNSIISNNRLSAYSNQFVAALNLARSEAVKRGTKVTVGRLGTTAKDWKDGWQVFVNIEGLPAGNTISNFLVDDTDANKCETDASGMAIEDCLLRLFEDKLPTGFTFLSNAEPITFNAMGKSKATTIVMCDGKRGTVAEQLNSAKVIIISNTGRVRIAVDTTDDIDSIPNLSDTTNLSSCTP